MVNVETYIKKDKIITSLENINENHSQYFVHCEDKSCLQYIENYDYIEGAITIFCDGVMVLDFSHWDLVDQLWSYIIDAIYELSKGETQVQVYFPDQPLKFEIQNVSAYMLLVVIEERKISVNKQEFIVALLENAKLFFSILNKCNNEDLVLHSKVVLEKIKGIKKNNII